jgi:hypothetical protein
MFEDYRNTSLFQVKNLKEIAHATRMRYLGQLKLSGFSQGTDGRLSVFGLRVISTKKATIRLFFQIWDAPNGSIVWEGVDELLYSEDTPLENAVTLKKVLERASTHLVDKLPKADARALP